jgi:inhibitor of KinA
MPLLYAKPVFRLVGDRGLLVEYGDAIDPEINRKVRAMALALEKEPTAGIAEVIPTYRSLLIVYDPGATDVMNIEEIVQSLERRLGELEIPPPKKSTFPFVTAAILGRTWTSWHRPMA